MNGDISPPPPKKRRINYAATSTSTNQTSSVASPDPYQPRPSLPPPPHHLRIFSWNVNGIDPFIQPSIGAYLQKKSTNQAISKSKHNGHEPQPPITTSLRNFLRRHHWPQVLHLQEVKINPSDVSTQRAIETAVNRCRSGSDDGPHYKVRFCLPRDKHNARGGRSKIYGVASIIRTDFLEEEVAAVREVDWDVEGRVLVIETHSKLALFNIYAINGTTNPYKDPTTGAIAGTRHDRKLAFHAAMLNECRQLETEGWRLVLAGDLNVASAEIDGHPRLRTKPEAHVLNRKDFNEKFLDRENSKGLGLVDSFRYLHPKKKRYTWMSRNAEWKESCDRVDYVLLSRNLVEAHNDTGDSGGTEDPGDHLEESRERSNGPGAVPNSNDSSDSRDRHGRKALIAADILMTPADRAQSDHFPLWVELNLTQ